VVVRATNRCVQESFLVVPSHGQRQTFRAIFIHRIADGMIVETWRNAEISEDSFNSGLGSSQRRRRRRHTSDSARDPASTQPREQFANQSGH
jgi:hypothetical protein